MRVCVRCEGVCVCVCEVGGCARCNGASGVRCEGVRVCV